MPSGECPTSCCGAWVGRARADGSLVRVVSWRRTPPADGRAALVGQAPHSALGHVRSPSRSTGDGLGLRLIHSGRARAGLLRRAGGPVVDGRAGPRGLNGAALERRDLPPVAPASCSRPPPVSLHACTSRCHIASGTAVSIGQQETCDMLSLPSVLLRTRQACLGLPIYWALCAAEALGTWCPAGRPGARRAISWR